MAEQFAKIEKVHQDFIARQHIFFVGSAAAESRVNLSPKPASALRVLGGNAAAYLDQTGSGNETAAHLLAEGRLTFMFCAFEGPARILRLYGRGRVLHRTQPAYAALLETEFGGEELSGARQIIVLDVDLVQTSCGFGVPLFTYVSDRDTLTRWAQTKGDRALDAYRRKRNVLSIDGLATGFAGLEEDERCAAARLPARASDELMSATSLRTEAGSYVGLGTGAGS